MIRRRQEAMAKAVREVVFAAAIVIGTAWIAVGVFVVHGLFSAIA